MREIEIARLKAFIADAVAHPYREYCGEVDAAEDRLQALETDLDAAKLRAAVRAPDGVFDVGL
jgi:hypothetical protein